VSYEITLTLSVVGVLLMVQSFNLREIIEHQQGTAWSLPHWHIFAGPFPQILGFVCYFIAAVAETNRAPFDLAEAEQELVAGFHTEYASMKFATFFIAEYTAMVTVAIVASLLFFGGWLSPFPAAWTWTQYLPTVGCLAAGAFLVWDGLRYPTKFGRIALPIVGIVLAGVGVLCAVSGVREIVQGPFWFLSKIFVFLFIYVWVRGTLPRFRYDQLMGFGWKLLLPVALANVLLTALAELVFK
jgi:NADH-quinone oxidoreductase subunit H